MCRCFAGRGTDALEKIEGIMKEEKDCVETLKQNLKISKLKVGQNWVFQQDRDPEHPFKVVTKLLKVDKVKVLEWPSQSLDLNSVETFGLKPSVRVFKEACKPD